MNEKPNRQPIGIPIAGQFAEKLHSPGPSALKPPAPQVTEEELERMGDAAASAVYESMPEASLQNDGAGHYLMFEQDEDSALIAGCPTLAADNAGAKWYISSTDGQFHEEHPTFDSTADPKDVSAWIRGVRATQPMGYGEKTALANQAVSGVNEALPEATVENFGASDFLMISVDGGDSHLVAECPVDKEGPEAKWNCYVNDGRFAESHPDFTYGSDPKEVASWVREVRARVPMDDTEKTAWGNRAVAGVHEAMPEAKVENFGYGDFLAVDIDGDESLLVAECPVDRNGGQKWRCYVNDGRFAETHPDFHPGTDPQEVASWIRDVKGRIPDYTPPE